MFIETRKFLPLFIGIITGVIIITLTSRNGSKIILCSSNELGKMPDDLNHKPGKYSKTKSYLVKKVKQTYFINIDEAKKLYSSVRILCYINTIPKTHKTKAIYVKNTWAKRCTKYLFMSSAYDNELPTVKLNLSYPESRKHLWSKMRAILRYVYQYRNDYDYFLKTDDDTFVVMENLRSILYQHNPNDPFMMGYNFPYRAKNGYFSGGAGYVLSKEALKRIVEQAIDKHPSCPTYDEDKEDVKMSICGQAVGVKLYHMADLNGTFPFTWRRELRNHYLFQWRSLEGEFLNLIRQTKSPTISKYSTTTPKTYDHLHDPSDLLSDYLVSLHYIRPFYMYLLEFILYHLRPIQQMDYLNE
ncbi:Glycoprotein-N-acetylgalactosamine 3-beta-galactosyltransferase 1 isoform 2 [Schistosoma japonicum]|uniref:N-acetylgalactosaminide beta-1,3-galactosyltransferase n=2 Tax=Schistosoma japonicum TaxID=6182 RepID=A0A4Z2D971_SCHJA|nr:Glycoprotein-N-acetylgalactosamine 3-beta-galactosyltransferase 1 [Schistosoma japonicum]TNN13024.1 Glycoprotein-N-acetylgalactosamine 3-beta-galactosyltransferase 1 isoform 2 [Schistosoma japonicum]TNN13025.1 Glycoprotein-N-acetylgalactosamine 3-beta-galactosyltransferase 1 isoform 2 [Schistosoma japonicum]